jgi:succinate-semialdehyde dehydrogenase/glutarate-semialdehyde dehydrogenase
MIRIVEPASGRELRSYPEMDSDQAREILGRTHQACAEWRSWSLERRAQPLRALTRLLRERSGVIAGLMAREMGKPVRQGASEAQKCAWTCEYFADNAARMLAPEAVATEAARSYVAFQPLGVVLAVMPWNFPFWQVFRCAAPGVMAGNAWVLKHASSVTGSALLIEELFREAGFPADLLRVLLLRGGPAVLDLIDDPRVAAVTLTGSGPAGRAVAERAGRNLKKTVLELGGSDAYLVLEDADLPLAARACARSRLINAGQSCIAAKRLIVTSPVREGFEELLMREMEAFRPGDPLDPDTELGPLAGLELRGRLHEQVSRSVERGARILLGGRVPGGPGAFYPPTVLSGVRPGMPAFDEELFGPVAAVVPAADEGEAIALANATPFGLGAAVFTSDPARGERIAAGSLEAGNCFVNDFVRSDPRLPFGGMKESGYGRELSVFGLREFTNVKTVWVA